MYAPAAPVIWIETTRLGQCSAVTPERSYVEERVALHRMNRRGLSTVATHARTAASTNPVPTLTPRATKII
jgi:hypothetical protein